MLDVLPAAAVRAAGAQDGVERVQRLAVESADGEGAEQRPDVVADVALVAPAGQHVHVEQFEGSGP